MAAHILVDSDILNKNDVLWPPKKLCFDWKQDSVSNMIYFLLEKVIRYAQIDCLMGIETGDSS